MRSLYVKKIIAFLLGAVCLGSTPSFAIPGDGHWDRQFNMPGTTSRNLALRFNGTSLYTGGYSVASGQIATNTVVNIFDGTNWTTIGDLTGSATTILEDFAFVGKDVYVGGVFNAAGGVAAAGLAKWDGVNWSSVGGFSGLVFSMTTDGTNLYVGGSFTNCGGMLITNIAKWDGTSWSSLGGGIGYLNSVYDSYVNVVLWQNRQLYAAGSFTNAGMAAITNIARWDGSTWSPVGGGISGVGSFLGSVVNDLQFVGNDLYAAGTFTTVGGNVSALNIAKWDGSSWSALGSGLKAPPNNSAVTALAAVGPDLYATGNFTNAGGFAARVAKWNGSSWSSLGAINGSGTRAESNSGSLYICGDFNVANFNTSSNVIGNNVLRWDGAAWHGVAGKPGQGTQTFVYTLCLGSDGLYVGGIMNVIGTTTASRIARWDGANWTALGNGLTAAYHGSLLSVRAIAAQANDVFVGGGFSAVDGVPANNVAMWDGSNWNPLGGGVDDFVFAVEATDTDVYVGGSFTNAVDNSGSYLVHRIARWDGFYWWPLGSGVSGTVNVIRAAGGLVYVGGSFTNAGGVAANRIAVWDGANWSSLGTGAANGVSSTVSSILVDGSDVYVGGSFTTAGGATARAIAKWNGSSWSPLGQGMFSTGTAAVSALAKIGSDLYAAGTFTNAGGSVITRNIARWDGANWQNLGSGVGNDFSPGASRISALVASGNDLFAGGTFETAGVSGSGYVARWNDQIDFTPPSVMRLANPQMLPGNTFKFRATATDNATYVVEYSPDLINWMALTTSSLSSLDITNPLAGVNVRDYRMRQIP